MHYTNITYSYNRS